MADFEVISDAIAELSVLEAADSFVSRHIAPSDKEIADMLRVVGADSLEALVGETVPPSIRVKANLPLPRALDEIAVIAELRAMAARNGGAKSLIGQGYHGTHTPPVILRNVLESPGWYTAYTPSSRR